MCMLKTKIPKSNFGLILYNYIKLQKLITINFNLHIFSIRRMVVFLRKFYNK